MNVAVLTSGGKDSLFAAYNMHSQGYTVTHFLTVLPESTESYMFHHPNVELTKVQAELMDMALHTKATKGEREKELGGLRELIGLVKGKVEGIVTGAIASNYQKSRIDAICKEMNLKSFAPLWQRNQEELLREMINEGFEVIITSVAAEGLDASWLGRTIDEKTVDELKVLNKKYRINIAGEGGEYETLVLDMPLFKKKIEVKKAQRRWEGTSGVYLVKNVELRSKFK